MGYTSNKNPFFDYFRQQGYEYFDQYNYNKNFPLPGFIHPTALPPPPPPAPPPPSDPGVPGLDLDKLAKATYGKQIPLCALGLSRIGGNIVAGPWLNANTASFGISFGFPANPSGTRLLFEIALDNQVAWEAPSGASTLAGGTFLSESFTARWYEGTLTQAVDPLETLHYGSEAVAYRPQMMLFFENLPLTAFGNKIPYVAAVIGDTTDGADPADGINLGTAIERIAYSPWAEHTSDTFDTDGIVDVVGAVLLADNFSIVDICRNLTGIYVNLDVLQSDKLWLKDRGALVSPDIVLTLDHILSATRPVTFNRRAPSTVPRELEFVTIDPDADYTWVPSKAQRPREPVPVSASVGKQTITLPLVMDASTRIAMAYYAEYVKENARKTVAFSTLAYGLNIEPGDRVALEDLGGGFENEVFKVTETVRGANFVVQCQAEAIMRCEVTFDTQPAFVACYNEGFASTATRTGTGLGFGEAAGNRRIILGISIRGSSGWTSGTTTITIGGVAATIHAFILNTGVGTSSPVALVCSAAVPTGASGDVVVTSSAGTFTAWTISIYRKLSGTIALHDTATAQATGSAAVTASLDVPAGGFMVAAALTRNGAQFPWSGAAADCTHQNTGWHSVASYTAVGSETNRPVTVDPVSTDHIAIAVASFTV